MPRTNYDTGQKELASKTNPIHFLFLNLSMNETKIPAVPRNKTKTRKGMEEKALVSSNRNLRVFA